MTFENFYKNNYTKHLKIMVRILHNKETAEDIVQEAYTRAWAGLDTYDKNRSSMSTWFNRILYNTLHDFQRKFKEELKVIAEWSLPPDVNSGYDVIVSIMPMLNKVKNKKHREVCALYYGFGYNTREISDLMEITQTNVTTIINRFRNKLQKHATHF